MFYLSFLRLKNLKIYKFVINNQKLDKKKKNLKCHKNRTGVMSSVKIS